MFFCMYLVCWDWGNLLPMYYPGQKKNETGTQAKHRHVHARQITRLCHVCAVVSIFLARVLFSRHKPNLPKLNSEDCAAQVLLTQTPSDPVKLDGHQGNWACANTSYHTIHSSHEFTTWTSHSVDIWPQTKMGSIEFWMPWHNALMPHWIWGATDVMCTAPKIAHDQGCDATGRSDVTLMHAHEAWQWCQILTVSICSELSQQDRWNTMVYLNCSFQSPPNWVTFHMPTHLCLMYIWESWTARKLHVFVLWGNFWLRR